MSERAGGAVEAVSGSGKSTETLSQFVARVFDQLSLSAWLPSAALVLSAVVIFQLGAILDKGATSGGPGAVLGATLASIASVSLGGALLLIVAVIVLTTLTQAFAFEAIRVLEGYWGTLRLAEALASRRFQRFSRKRVELLQQQRSLTRAAWQAARAAIEREQSLVIRSGHDSDVRHWSADMLTYLGAKLLGQDTDVRLDQESRLASLAIPWERYAPPDLLRRQVNLDRRLRDFPTEGRALPTRLGNVLRAHEDQTGRSRVETFVLELYELLPPTLRRQHDEQRNRLDLYSSMVFVLLFVAALAVVRLWGNYSAWAVGCALVALLGAWLSYRAAVASARVYGLLLVEIARRYPTAP